MGRVNAAKHCHNTCYPSLEGKILFLGDFIFNAN